MQPRLITRRSFITGVESLFQNESNLTQSLFDQGNQKREDCFEQITEHLF